MKECIDVLERKADWQRVGWDVTSTIIAGNV